jgi:hypothetical protein
MIIRRFPYNHHIISIDKIGRTYHYCILKEGYAQFLENEQRISDGYFQLSKAINAARREIDHFLV